MTSEFYNTSPSQSGGPMAIMLALIVGFSLFAAAVLMLVLPLG